MRKILASCTAAGAVMAAATFSDIAPAPAMTIATPAALGAAAQQMDLKQGVAYVCRGGWRWHRCFWRPRHYWGYSFYRPYAYTYAYRPYAYSYGYPYGAYAYAGVGPRLWLGWRWRRRWW
jgi:hypothetical protein